ncbi:hypothetical protein GCM10009641_86140 [Mycobacterium cookii]|uniref:Uncharacterized protein n=2 Tax=Nocardioides furvisabuli TaxID=375542 RepID=A0ABP5J2Q3_9ACTN
MAVTPAGAEVSQAVGTNWKKIWKKNLKPLAQKSFYTKKQTKARFQPKGSYETAGSGYTKAESDAKYAGAGSSYTKAETDAKYAPAQPLYRGNYFMSAAAGTVASTGISYGATFPSQPTVHFIPAGAALPAGCSGTAAAPNAAPGNLCVFEASSSLGAVSIVRHNLSSGSDVFGFSMFAFAPGGARGEGLGSWAARPSGPVTNPVFAPAAPGAKNGTVDSGAGGVVR